VQAMLEKDVGGESGLHRLLGYQPAAPDVSQLAKTA
jgi:hypothetical protein